MADTLLMVDDDASVLRAIGEYFERIGYEVWREGTGEQAMETFQRVRPARCSAPARTRSTSASCSERTARTTSPSRPARGSMRS